ncbi:O-methyltransferase-domain-containing protein [Aspergillus pseudocaelatus]|uniref:O-methyltransferase-domain-containing protein n=1 Tax=Aspergillus pseudocaelatus TaxID=1825620 RepID=A0ABQ6WZQ6_9EURO|nr:O-methyltransferase-domain-containing protein [Aspergillus pseudocaelatus]
MAQPNKAALVGLANTLSELVKRYVGTADETKLSEDHTHCMESVRSPSSTEYAQAWEIVRTCDRISSLIHGPVPWLLSNALSHLDSACLAAATQLNLQDIIVDGPSPTSLKTIVAATGVSEDLLRRILRGCAQRFIFEEVAADQFAHTDASKMLCVTGIHALVGFSCPDQRDRVSCDEVMRSGACFSDFLQQTKGNPPSWNVPSPFSLAFDPAKGLFDYYSMVDEVRGRRFDLGMGGTEATKPLVEEMFDFSSLPEGSTVVDVGGGRGHLSRRVSQKYPHLRFIVQDLPAVIHGVEDTDKVTMMEHDIRHPNPVRGADVYFLRSILHDYPDAACVEILSNIVSAMDPTKSRILLDEMVVPDLLAQDSQRFMNQIDMTVVLTLNGKERSTKEWDSLIATVGGGLEIEKTWWRKGEEGSHWGVQQLRLRGNSAK